MFFFQFEITVNGFISYTLSASFKYLCYGSTAIRNILLFQCGDRGIIYLYVWNWSLETSDSDVGL